MERIERLPGPGWLKEKSQQWQQECKVGNANPGSIDFGEKEKREEVVDTLSDMTKEHCSFCDAFPMGKMLEDTIEHFRPKAKFPELAYEWENLFLACRKCQKAKRDKFDEKLLRPDKNSYSFDRYFDIETDTGKLKPNINASKEDQERAELTIKLYGLNDSRRLARKMVSKYYAIVKKHSHVDIDEWAYRFYIRRADEANIEKERYWK